MYRNLHNLLAVLLTMAALAIGQTAQATITRSMAFEGFSNSNQSLHYWRIHGFWGTVAGPTSGSPGTSQTFNNTFNFSGGNRMTINGTLNFAVANNFTDVTTGSEVTLVFESSNYWFYGATVKTLSDANVSSCTYSISDNHQIITVTIPSGKTFGNVYLDLVSNPPMTNDNTIVTVPAGDYWVSNESHRPTPVPTVTYNGNTIQGTNYTLSWSNNHHAGNGTVTVTGTGNYAGSATGTFPIRWATYTVHFDKNHNNATGTMANQAFTYATSQHLTANAFSRTYYTFAGWSTTPNGAVTYTDGQSVNNLTAVDGQIVTLYANWTPITYNITYDLDGGSVAIANPTSYTIETPTFTLNNPTKDGYTFAGWTGSNGNTPQTTVTITQGTTGNLNYTAHWTPITYNITYDLDGGSVATANPTTYNIETPTFTLNNPTKLACNFDGWTGSNGDTPETTVTIAQGSYGDRNYTANWTQYAFTLTLGTDITASGTVVFTLDGTDYYTPGTPITLGFSGTIPEGGSVTYSVNGTPIEGNSFVMPAQDTEVTAIIRGPRYTFDSSTGALTLNWGEFNKNNKWGSEVDPSKVRSVTATDEVSFTGDCFNLFYNFTNCTSMDLSNVNTDALTSMYCMFWGCSSLQSLDLSSWNTAAVTAMTLAFYGCEGLTSLNLKGWNTASVTTMEKMFYECHNLTTIEGISEWVTASVTSMEEMFSVCCDLQSLNLSGWNTANVTKMLVMFNGCSSLQSLDLSGWNTSNVEDMYAMFNGCSSLQSLDLSGWNTSIVWDMSAMFFGCSSLTTIYVGEGWNTESVTSSNYMFTDCTNLVGGMGTGYDANHTNKEYARIDKGPSSDQPGYLTGRFNKEIVGYGTGNGRWVFIASPVLESIIPSTDNHFIGTQIEGSSLYDFDLYRFNQSGTNGEWENYHQHHSESPFWIENGKGYLYARKDDVTLHFDGVPNTDDTKTVNLAFDENEPFAGYNLVGNPFLEEATIDRNYYTMNAEGTGIVANEVSKNVPIPPFTGVIVQATGDLQTVSFTKGAKRGETSTGKGSLNIALSQVVERAEVPEPVEGPRGGVSTSSTTAIDNAIVSFNEGSQLGKFYFGEQNGNIYIPQGGEEYAIVSVGRDVARYVSTEVPVNFKAKENGEYTITVNPEGVEMGYLHLIDNMTGADIDLFSVRDCGSSPAMTGSNNPTNPSLEAVIAGEDPQSPAPTYTFTAKTTDYESRFKLVFSTNGDGPSTGSGAFAFINNGNIIVNGEGTVQVVDVMGRVVYQGDAINRVSTGGMTAGVYVLRLINGEDMKTQKVVVQ